MNHDVKHIMMDASADISVTASNSDITLPTGFLHFTRVQVPFSGGYRTLQQQTLEQNADIREGRNGAVGIPWYYAIVNMTTAELAPTPQEAVTLKCTYRKKLEAFTTDSDTDVVLTSFPNAYLYATMLEATTYINSDKRVVIWTGMYEEEMNRIAEADYEARWSDSPRSISNLTADTP
jgi:hypothetical protein